MNIKKIIKSERGDVSYISTFVYILVAMIMVAFILNVFHIISVKQEMDHISDQLVKQIQTVAQMPILVPCLPIWLHHYQKSKVSLIR